MIRPEPHYRRAAFDDGLKRAGYKLTPIPRPESRDDLLVMWNRHQGANEQQALAWEAAGGTVLVIENGYLQRVDKSMYAISVGQHNGAGWFPVGDEDRFSKLGFEMKPWRKGGTEIVVRAQRGIGSKLMASPGRWAETTANALRARTKLQVRIAPHPGDKGKQEVDARNLVHAHALVIWSSAMGVRALTEGIPVFQCAPHWVCAGCATTLYGFPNVTNHNDEARRDALHKMSHGQWSPEEIATGRIFATMREQNWGRKC
jgi:hypothetical protein